TFPSRLEKSAEDRLHDVVDIHAWRQRGGTLTAGQTPQAGSISAVELRRGIFGTESKSTQQRRVRTNRQARPRVFSGLHGAATSSSKAWSRRSSRTIPSRENYTSRAWTSRRRCWCWMARL